MAVRGALSSLEGGIVLEEDEEVTATDSSISIDDDIINGNERERGNKGERGNKQQK